MYDKSTLAYFAHEGFEPTRDSAMVLFAGAWSTAMAIYRSLPVLSAQDAGSAILNSRNAAIARDLTRD
jgi:hypothetical protein